jgi:hypothetical protein
LGKRPGYLVGSSYPFIACVLDVYVT